MMPADRAIGGITVSPIGLGCAGLSLDHADRPVRAARTIRAAQRAGISLFDTAIAYAPPGRPNHNEHLVRAALHFDPEQPVFIATKGGHIRDGDAFTIDARPETLRAHCESSLHALGVERIDLYFLHWPDPRVPIEESVGALADLQRVGKIDQIGVSNVALSQLRRAQLAAPIAAVENRLSIFDQGHRDVVDHCAAAGIAFLAYSPLGGAGTLANGSPPARLAAIARRHDALPAQVALAWLLALSPNVIPIVGASRAPHARQAAAAVTVSLTAAEIDVLTAPRTPRRLAISIEHPQGDQ